MHFPPIAIAALSIAMLSTVSAAQDAPCNTAKVHYSAPSDTIAKNIRISTTVGNFDFPSAKKELSPQTTRWLLNVEPDYMKNGPWKTTLFIGDHFADKPFTKIEFLNHGNSFSAEWLNEELIYIQVPWGRIASSDLIFDVEKKQFIYNQVANYGEITFCKPD